MIVDPTMDVNMNDLEVILGGISEDGAISPEAEAVLRAYINAGRDRGLPMLEVKRQLRCHLDAVNGRKVADAIGRLW